MVICRRITDQRLLMELVRPQAHDNAEVASADTN